VYFYFYFFFVLCFVFFVLFFCLTIFFFFLVRPLILLTLLLAKFFSHFIYVCLFLFFHPWIVRLFFGANSPTLTEQSIPNIFFNFQKMDFFRRTADPALSQKKNDLFPSFWGNVYFPLLVYPFHILLVS
jgi:hypothetical protein